MHDIWNPWHGCTKCSPGCQNCYMCALDEMRGVLTPSSEVRRTNNFRYPLSKNRQKQFKVAAGERIRVNMTSDTFVPEAAPWLEEFWGVIRQRPDVIFWILTKRPERILSGLPSDWGNGWENVSLNVTCENQEMFDKRWPVFQAVPAKHKGLCLAPLIGPVDITPALASGTIEEVSAGGENYNNPRDCHDDWARDLSQQCERFKINFCWYETGTNLIKDGVRYFMPQKQTQAQQAFFAGYNRFYGPIKYALKHPDGSPVEKPYSRRFNLNHCLFCSNQMMCNGCSECGNCGPDRKIVSEQEFLDIQQAHLNKNSGG